MRKLLLVAFLSIGCVSVPNDRLLDEIQAINISRHKDIFAVWDKCKQENKDPQKLWDEINHRYDEEIKMVYKKYNRQIPDPSHFGAVIQNNIKRR